MQLSGTGQLILSKAMRLSGGRQLIFSKDVRLSGRKKVTFSSALQITCLGQLLGNSYTRVQFFVACRLPREERPVDRKQGGIARNCVCCIRSMRFGQEFRKSHATRSQHPTSTNVVVNACNSQPATNKHGDVSAVQAQTKQMTAVFPKPSKQVITAETVHMFRQPA